MFKCLNTKQGSDISCCFFFPHCGVEHLYWPDLSNTEHLLQENWNGESVRGSQQQRQSEAVVAEVQLQPASKNGGCFVSPAVYDDRTTGILSTLPRST